MSSCRQKGFSLIELMIVVAVIALLVTLGLYGANRSRASARDVARKQNIKGLAAGLTRYASDQETYPENLVALVSSGYLQELPPDPSDHEYTFDSASGCVSVQMESSSKYFAYQEPDKNFLNLDRACGEVQALGDGGLPSQNPEPSPTLTPTPNPYAPCFIYLQPVCDAFCPANPTAWFCPRPSCWLPQPVCDFYCPVFPGFWFCPP